jgi:hypothetical protein
VQEAHPDLARHLIFTTGDRVSQDSRAFLEQVSNPCISKPFRRGQVLTEIKELLAV